MRDTGRIYGSSLYSLAKDENLQDQIRGQLSAINENFVRSRDFFKGLDAPQISLEEKLRTIDAVFEGCHPYVINTLKILAEKRSCGCIGYLFKQYKKMYNIDNDISEVTAITAVPLSKENEKKLIQKLSTLLGGKILLTNKVDPSIIGGVVIRTEGLQIDGGVKHRLDEIKKEIVR